jgi:putative transposase
MKEVQELAVQIGKTKACRVLNVPRSSYYRFGQPRPTLSPRPRPARALSCGEQQEVLEVLRGERFVDCAPVAVWATLLDEGVYYCSTRTMYRLLDAHGEVRERRDHLRHPRYSKPELLAQGPNQVWTWDITELRGPVKYQRYYLYVILDLYSRYVVAWMVAEVQSYELAKELINQAIEREQIAPDQLTIHSDRGATMMAKPLGFMLADLGILKSHSRPRCCNDNPFVESHFRTLKYRPAFPDRFGSISDARQFCRTFFDWYHHQHRHSGLGWMSPQSVHHGEAQTMRQQRQEVLDAAYAKKPERFVGKPPQAPKVPSKVWINPPSIDEVNQKENEPTNPVGTVTVENQASQLPCERSYQEGGRVDTPLEVLQEKVDGPKPLFGLELNYENRLSQSR